MNVHGQKRDERSNMTTKIDANRQDFDRKVARIRGYAGRGAA